MDGLGLLIAIVSFVLVLMALSKIAKLETRIAQLKLQLGNAIEELGLLRSGMGPAIAPAPEPAPLAAEPEETVSEAAEPVVEAAAPETEAPEPAAVPSRPAGKGDMEQALASRWFVWIGGAAIAIGGLLFVKYAYDNNLIPPTLQIILGLLLGAALVAAGEFVRRKSAPALQQSYVPAALSAGGIVTAFGSIYAANALYELISPTLAFGGLAAVALGALALSRLQGPLIAALGLIGSYATPMLIPSEHPSAWGFFPYLLVILVASFATLRGKNWWWLGHAAIAGSFIWTLLWLVGRPFDSGDTLAVGLFAHVMGFIAFYGIAGPAILEEASGDLRRPASLTPALQIGLVGLAAESLLLGILVQQAQHNALALALFMAAMVGLAAIGWKKSGLDILAAAAAAFALVVLMAWKEVAFHTWAMDENGLWSSLLGPVARQFLYWMLAAGAAATALGCLGARLKTAPVLWGGIGGASAILFVFGAWGRVDALLSPIAWAILGVLAALVLLATAYPSRARHDAETAQNLSSGLLSAGAGLLLLFAADRLFDGVWLTLAIAALALVFALLAGVMRVTLQGSIAAAMGALVTIRLFVSRSLWLDDRTLPWGQHWLIYGYGVPAILFLISSRALKAAGYVKSAISLEGLSLGLVISLISLEIRVLIGGGITAEDPGLLEISAHILTWLGAAYGLLYRQKLYSSDIAAWGARLLLAISVFAILGLSLLVLNPLVTGDPLRGSLVFNTLLLSYLAPIPLLALIGRKLDTIGWRSLQPLVGVLALILAFAYVTLETKRAFQGPVLVPWSESVAESYAYSAVWLGLALALFVAGLKLARQYVRYAGLGVMVLVVLKVFLWDMSGLEGLYRIASFIGLGLSLIGIGWLYQHYVQPPKPVTS